MAVKHKAQRAAAGAVLDQLLKYVDKDPQANLLKLMDKVQGIVGNLFPAKSLEGIRKGAEDPENVWNQFAMSILRDIDRDVIKKMFLALGLHAAYHGTKTVRENREKYQCNIPWIILLDPTSACNLKCKGCWAAEYGNRLNLSYDELDSIITQGKELGVYLYMLTGGEPLVRKADVLRLAEKHNDVQFAIYTNSTLIDDAFCEEVARLGNIAFMLSIEGSPETNDARRGSGHYTAVMDAMDRLRTHGILFGTSICYTSANLEAVTSDRFLRMLSDKGAHFGFYFHYMPVGNDAAPELLPTPEQRRYMIQRIRYLRSAESDIPFFPMDFQNDGQYVGGCIAGGRNYFHINSAGDAEPCVFIHYSDRNIHSSSILEILRSPLFMAYRDGQPFNKNHLRPCPMLENPEKLRCMVHETSAHSTDLQSPESVDHLCDKCQNYADAWQKAADEIWDALPHREGGYQNYKTR